LDGPAWSVPVAATGRSLQALEATRAAGLEGVVVKKLDSSYQPGKRSRSWIKIRNVRTLDAIVGGWVPGRGRLREQPGSVLVGQ
jgi:bifunctional non-homologous end joining protein LigD